MSGTAKLTELFSAANEGAAHADLRQQAAGFAVYVHVPFCRVRCGYCDFNTYVNGFGAGADRTSYHDSARRELALAAQFLRHEKLVPPPASSVYFGGGTPTLLSVRALRAILEEVESTWGIAPGAEVSIEANPDTITAPVAQELAASGFTRVSLGMQSAVPQVLATLERTHCPENLPQAVAALRGAGLAVSLDLIYGTPGESLADWEASLQAGLGGKKAKSFLAHRFRMLLIWRMHRGTTWLIGGTGIGGELGRAPILISARCAGGIKNIPAATRPA